MVWLAAGSMPGPATHGACGFPLLEHLHGGVDHV